MTDAIVSTSVPQNPSGYGRNVSNPNLQQHFFTTIAYGAPPLPPVGTGVPYGPVPDAIMDLRSACHMFHHIIMSHLRHRLALHHHQRVSKTNLLAYLENLVWNLKVKRGHIKNHTLIFLIRRLIRAVLEFLILLSLRGKMVDRRW